MDTARIDCVVFDFGFTLSSDPYFKELDPGAFDLVQQHLFDDKALMERWMNGELSSRDICNYLSGPVGLPAEEILDSLRGGCSRLLFNDAVWNCAVEQRGAGRKTTLVTANMDVFTEVIVPKHGLADIFDAIVSSSDHGTVDKEVLWSAAYDALGGGYEYKNSLLIEDSLQQVEIFRRLGGQAYQYTGEEAFLKWRRSVGL